MLLTWKLTVRRLLLYVALLGFVNLLEMGTWSIDPLKVSGGKLTSMICFSCMHKRRNIGKVVLLRLDERNTFYRQNSRLRLLGALSQTPLRASEGAYMRLSHLESQTARGGASPCTLPPLLVACACSFGYSSMICIRVHCNACWRYCGGQLLVV